MHWVGHGPPLACSALPDVLLYHDLNYAIVIGPMRVTCCAKINNVLSLQHHVLGNMASRDPCSRGTWCKPRDTMYLRQFFGPTAVFGKWIRIRCCCIMDDDTNVLHLFHDITKQTLTDSLDQHWKIMPPSRAMLPEGTIFSVALGISQYCIMFVWAYECVAEFPLASVYSHTGCHNCSVYMYVSRIM